MSPVLRPWWPALAWAAAILALTTAPVSAPSPVRAAPGLDKLVHFGLYLGLGRSLARGLWSSGPVTAARVLAALVGGLAYGAFTEWIQRPIAVRDPSLADWLADAAGVSVGLAAFLWPRTRRAGGESKADGSARA